MKLSKVWRRATERAAATHSAEPFDYRHIPYDDLMAFFQTIGELMEWLEGGVMPYRYRPDAALDILTAEVD
jgi:hypothetical protein